MPLESDIYTALFSSAAISTAIGVVLKLVLEKGIDAKIRFEADERMSRLTAALTRVEKLEDNLHQKRQDSYAEVWTSTGAVNLFGKSNECNQVALSRKLSDWYFTQGWTLSEQARTHYFLVQEVLSYAILRSIEFKRPTDDILLTSEHSPVDVLWELRKTMLHLPKNLNPRVSIGLDALRAAVVAWKNDPGNPQETAAQEKAWVIFQLVASTFRSRLTKEQGSREPIRAVGR